MMIRLASIGLIALQLVAAAPAVAQAGKVPTGAAALTEIEAIKQLKARYYRLLDTQKWAEWRQVFADDLDAKLDSAPAASGDPRTMAITGADAFVERLSTALAKCLTVHHGHLPEITLTSATTATGIWAMEDISECQGRPTTSHGFGYYSDTYRKDAKGNWKIATLRMTRLKVEQLPVVK